MIFVPSRMSRVLQPLGVEVSQYMMFFYAARRCQSHFSEVAFDKVMTGTEFSKADQERFINSTQGPLRMLDIDIDKESVSVARIHEQFKKKSAECNRKTMKGQKKLRDLSMAHKLLTDSSSAYYSADKVFSDRKRSKLYVQLLPLHKKIKYKIGNWVVVCLGITFVYVLTKGMVRPAMKLRQKRKSLE